MAPPADVDAAHTPVIHPLAEWTTRIERLEDRADSLERTIGGAPREDNPGVLVRLGKIEKVIERYQQMEWMMRGALVLMVLSATANVTIAAVLGRALAAMVGMEMP